MALPQTSSCFDLELPRALPVSLSLAEHYCLVANVVILSLKLMNLAVLSSAAVLDSTAFARLSMLSLSFSAARRYFCDC